MTRETSQNQDGAPETREYDPVDFETPIQSSDQPIERDGFIAPSDFVGGSGPANLANLIVAGKPAGWTVPLGHIAGFARSFERKEGTIKGPDGKLLETTWFKGAFRAMIYDQVNAETGELMGSHQKAAPYLILPRSAAVSLEDALSGAPEGARAVIDHEIGLKATGKSIAYRYTVGDYAPDPVQRELERMQNRHIGRLKARGAQARLAAPKTAAAAE